MKVWHTHTHTRSGQVQSVFGGRKRIRFYCDELNTLVPLCHPKSDKVTTLQWTTAYLRYIHRTHGNTVREVRWFVESILYRANKVIIWPHSGWMNFNHSVVSQFQVQTLLRKEFACSLSWAWDCLKQTKSSQNRLTVHHWTVVCPHPPCRSLRRWSHRGKNSGPLPSTRRSVEQDSKYLTVLTHKSARCQYLWR